MLNLMDMTLKEIEEYFKSMNQPAFRGKQVYTWINKGIYDIDDMTNISKDIRNTLKEKAHTGMLDVEEKYVSKLDGTIKYLFRLKDGNIIESVVMEYKHGNTVCISTQIGCKMGCKFCASAKLGFVRNLTSGEMLGQVITAGIDSKKKINNIVLMGIGEPFDNYENVIKFIKNANCKEGLNIGGRHFTISTSGIIPGIYDLVKEDIQINLSISLHSADNAVRNSIMPVNNKYSIDKLLEACKIYTKETRRRITFEYAVIAGINDSEDEAERLGRLIKGMLCHVNIISVNKVEGTGYNKSNIKTINKFVCVLNKYGIEATVRREMGSDINAACGQLRRSFLSGDK